ncbi:uncharacterized protein LOC117816247 isoform X1 [Notolabrus celidotus]|uniref:uncharacterized protein LOC117816247 isoform X1 n=1 Tax=Notolabrus celidotus TaxID=1203425 RepID=UPI00148F7EF6|nr:uncharacterized protein LOC117816247 isoform X1 [Notolabrus celidotus]
MSADDFQTKYASVMESMLKSAVAETTKLFETMVDELKAEISKMKKENEDLKEKCSKFENAKRETTDDTSESEPVLIQRDGSEKRDTAIQCDLGPFRAMLVEQCEPLQPSSWQNQEQQCGYDTQQYVWQEHNYENREGRDSQMAFILVKRKGSVESLQETVFKQEEVEPISSSGQVFGDKVGTQAVTSAGGIQNEGCITNQKCSNAEIPLAQRNEEAQVTLKLPQLGMDSSLLEVRNQSSDLELSLSTVKDDDEKDSEIGLQISGIRSPEELLTSKRQTLVVAPNQPEAEFQQNEQPSNADWPRKLADIQSTEAQFYKPTTPKKYKAFDELQNGLSEVEPDLPVRRRRGRPPKKAKTLQQPVKQMCLPSSNIPAEQEVKKYPATRLREVKTSSNVESVSMQGKADTDLAEKEKCTAGSLAVSVSSLSRKRSYKNKKITESQEPPMDTKDGEIQAPSTEVSSTVAKQNTPTTESLQEPSHQSRERRTSATLQDAMLLVEAMNQSTEKNVLCSLQRRAATTQTLQTVEEVPVEPGKPPILFEKEGALQAPDGTTTATALAKKEAVTPNPQHTDPPPSTSKSSVATSTTATQTSVHSVQHPHLHPPIKPISPSKQGDAVPQKIIVMSRSSAPLMPCKFAGKSPTQLPSVVSTVSTAQSNSDLPTLIPTGIPPFKPSLCSVPQKTIYITQEKSLPSITLQSTAPPTELQSGSLSQPKITILIPRELSAVASRKRSQAIAGASRQESAKSYSTDMSPSSELMSFSQEVRGSGDPQLALDEVSSTKLTNTHDNLESYQQTVSLKSVNESTEISSSSDILLGLVPTSISPLTVEQAPTAVVRLTRLSFPMSTKDAVMLSSRHSNESSETQSLSQEDTRKEKPSSVVISTQPSETQVFSYDICVNSKETSAADFVKASQMSEKSRTRESPPLSSEKCTVLDDSTDGEYVAAELPTYELEEETSIAVQDPTLPNVPPIEQQSPAVIHLMSIKSKDSSDPHSQMTKTQFLAQLAVSPIVQDQTELSTCDSVDADAYCPTTSANDEKNEQGDSLVTKLRRHLKTHLQGRTSTTNQESCTETEILTASPKKPRFEEDSLDDQSPTIASILLNPISQGRVMNTSPDKTINDPSPISTRRSRIHKDGVRSKRSVSEPAPVSPRRLKATGGSTPINLRSSSGRDCIGSKIKVHFCESQEV